MVVAAPSRIPDWLEASERGKFAEFWSGPDAEAPFDVFYREAMRHLRADHAAVLRAIDRISAPDRHALTTTERYRLIRLRGHALSGIGELRKASSAYQKAWRGFEREADELELARTGIGWVGVLTQIGEYDEALALARQAKKSAPRSEALLRARLDANTAIVWKHLGRFDSAKAAYLSARRRFLGANHRRDAAIMTYACAHNELSQGRSRPARDYFQEAIDAFEEVGWKTFVLQAEAGIHFTEILEGKWDQAVTALDGIVEQLRSLGDARTVATIYRAEAEFLTAAGAYHAATDLAERALQEVRKLGIAADVAAVSFLHARALGALGRHHDARVRLQGALDFWERSGNRRARNRAAVELAATYLARDDVESALPLLRRATRRIDLRDRLGLGVRCRHLLAECYVRQGRGGLATRLARSLLPETRRHPARLERPWIALTLASGYALRGEHPDALRWARRSVQEMEKLYLSFGTQTMRAHLASTRTDLTQRIVRLVRELPRADAAKIAMDLVSRARSPQLIEDLLQEGTRWTPEERAQIASLRNELLAAHTDRTDVRSGAVRELRSLEESLGQRRARPSAVVKRALEERDFSEWARSLEGRSLVLFDVHRNHFGAYIADSSREARYVALNGVSETLRRDWLPLRMILERAARLAPEAREKFLEATRKEATAALERLHDVVWAPLDIQRGDVALVVDGALGALPFEAIAPADCLLSRLPHPSLVRRSRRSPNRRALLLHDRAPARHDEAKQIRRLLTKAGFRVTTASRTSALGDGTRLGVLHVAAHGAFHRDQWISNGIRLSDGWLGFEQLERGALRNALVFFGSCESGLRIDRPGAGLDGWMAAAVAAGAREVLLTLWKIDDEGATSFARDFYSSWVEGQDAPRAAAQARALARLREPHPYAWAPFCALG